MNPNRSNYPDEQRALALVLAIGMHVLLAGFLLFSVQWKTQKPEPVVVELWGAPPPAKVASEQREVTKPVKVVETKPQPAPIKPTVAPKEAPVAKAPPIAKKPAVAKKPASDLEDALGMDNLLGGSGTEKSSPNAKVGGKAGGTGDTVGATGGAGKGKGSGLGEGYARGVGQDIKQKIVYSLGSQNPRVVYKIYLFPSGKSQ